MKSAIFSFVLLGGLLLTVLSFADTAHDAVLAQLAAEAKQSDPSFTSFSAERGAQFWQAQHTGGKPDIPSCTTCHTKDPTAEGRTRAGKTIAPMAVSRKPDRFTDPAKVEKWFSRNCNIVLGRPCTAAEKGDIITYLSTQ